MNDTYTHNQLAAPIVASDGQASGGKETVTAASPGHLVMAMHALTFGALSATAKMISGEASPESWTADFKSAAAEGAQTMTPVGGFVLNKAFASE